MNYAHAHQKHRTDVDCVLKCLLNCNVSKDFGADWAILNGSLMAMSFSRSIRKDLICNGLKVIFGESNLFLWMSTLVGLSLLSHSYLEVRGIPEWNVSLMSLKGRDKPKYGSVIYLFWYSVTVRSSCSARFCNLNKTVCEFNKAVVYFRFWFAFVSAYFWIGLAVSASFDWWINPIMPSSKSFWHLLSQLSLRSVTAIRCLNVFLTT